MVWILILTVIFVIFLSRLPKRRASSNSLKGTPRSADSTQYSQPKLNEPTVVRYNSEHVETHSKMHQVFKNLEYLESAIVFVCPEIIISTDESHIDTLCSKYAALLVGIIVAKSNTSKSYHLVGEFYNPEGLLLSAICSYMHLLLPCNLEKISRLAVSLYYRQGNKPITEETIILNSCYIDYLKDQADKRMPGLVHELNKSIALFIANPSNLSFSQLLESYQSIAEAW